jgi:hypothetical protein
MQVELKIIARSKLVPIHSHAVQKLHTISEAEHMRGECGILECLVLYFNVGNEFTVVVGQGNTTHWFDQRDVGVVVILALGGSRGVHDLAQVWIELQVLWVQN